MPDTGESKQSNRFSTDDKSRRGPGPAVSPRRRPPESPVPYVEPYRRIGSGWEVAPRHGLEGEYVEEDYLPEPPTPAELRREEGRKEREARRLSRLGRPDATPDSEEKLSEHYQEQRRKRETHQSKPWRKINRKPKDWERVVREDRQEKMRAETLATTGWGMGTPSAQASLVLQDIQHPRITSVDREELVLWKKKRDKYEDELKANAQ
ncbi:hypothetical protein DYB32_010643, partial [Aphanomyces invadans]